MDEMELYDHDEQPVEEEIIEEESMGTAYGGLVSELKKCKDRAVRHKSEVEQRWIEDERQYWGFRQPSEEPELEAPPIDNKTQSKVDIAAARIGDMLFPTNDRNWALSPTPRPTDIDGQEIETAVADEAVESVETIIDDFLNECQYPKHGRQAIHDACRIGVGVIKGPFARMSTRRRVRRESVQLADQFGNPVMDQMGQPVVEEQVRLEIVQETQPGSTRIDPWMFFPLPCRDLAECEGVFEMHTYPRVKLAQLAQHPGFDPEAVNKLASETPHRTDEESSLMNERAKMLRQSSDNEGEEFLVWEYHGPIDAAKLRILGIEVDHELDMAWGEVWFSNRHVLKVDLNAILGDERVPYYVFPYRRDDADILNSYGISRIMRDDQRTIDICYEAMQHNVRLTAGPQTIYWEGRAVPADGNYLVDGPKTWRVTDDMVKTLDEVISFNPIESSLPNIMPLYEYARENADTNSQLPILAGGEAMDPKNQTASGIAMVMNASNVVQRRAAHIWDDEITLPMLTRYYWWLMEFHDDDSIKVEMQVDPRGASYLLVKDKQAQHGMMALNLASSDPMLQAELKMPELYKTVFQFLDVPTDRLFKSEEDKEQAGEDPGQQMQMQMMQAEIQQKSADAAKAEMEVQQMQAEMQRPDASYDREQMDYQMRMAELEAKMTIAQMERDSRLATAAANENVSIAKLEAQLNTAEQDRAVKAQVEQMKLNQKEMESRRRQYAEGVKTRLQMQKQQQREQNLDRGFDSF